jgi:hypothetical protein
MPKPSRCPSAVIVTWGVLRGSPRRLHGCSLGFATELRRPPSSGLQAEKAHRGITIRPTQGGWRRRAGGRRVAENLSIDGLTSATARLTAHGIHPWQRWSAGARATLTTAQLTAHGMPQSNRPTRRQVRTPPPYRPREEFPRSGAPSFPHSFGGKEEFDTCPRCKACPSLTSAAHGSLASSNTPSLSLERRPVTTSLPSFERPAQKNDPHYPVLPEAGPTTSVSP